MEASVPASHSDEKPLSAPQTKRVLYVFGREWPEFNDGLAYTDVFRCTADQPARTLIDFYSSNYKNSAPILGWIQRICKGQVTVDGAVVTDPNFVPRDGSVVVYNRLPWKEPFAPSALQVLYEDNDLVVINKPSGLQVLPGGLFQQRTVLTQLQWGEWRKDTSTSIKQKTADLHPVPVHRLGRGTSGILLCAKTKFAKNRLACYFAEGTSNAGSCRDALVAKAHHISKYYRALVTGIIENDEFMISQRIGRVQYPGVAHGLYAASSSGKPAFSKIIVLERNVVANQSLVQVEIFSGRPHQIRIHMAYIGHPLLGDPLYGIGGCPRFDTSENINDSVAEDGGYEKPLQPVPGDCGYHLHAHRVVLPHPTTDEILEITASLPLVLQTRQEIAETPQKVFGDDVAQ